MKTNNPLICKLLEFKASNDIDQLTVEFREIAEYILLRGHLSVDFGIGKGYDIYLRDVEFFFHDEKDLSSNGKRPIKDYVVYHRNNHKNFNPSKKEKRICKYLPVGSFYGHFSGIDLTFENEQKQYRASILIRNFTVIDKEYRKEPIYENRPTYLYEYFIPNLERCISWVEDDDIQDASNKIKSLPRKNVFLYLSDDKFNPTKSKQPDKRMWQFKRNIIYRKDIDLKI